MCHVGDAGLKATKRFEKSSNYGRNWSKNWDGRPAGRTSQGIAEAAAKSVKRFRRRALPLQKLLIVAIISSIIISGLMYLVVELLTADQREASPL
ncbi:hypothetical protein O77CONTIG1_01739 [Leptolyngbya sp. O-77]|nr:hypothetical protein O77CONTIG1_01739 [Leptolyngbya sp. O-77]